MSNGLENNAILTPLQKKIMRILFSDSWFHSVFFLTGGTALSAYYLQHRLSEDLDFFTHETFPPHLPNTVRHLLSPATTGLELITQAPTFLRFVADDSLKLDFAVDTAARFGLPAMFDGIRVDNEENIAVNKVCTILSRLDPKDYVDLFFLIRDRNYSIDDLLKKGRDKDGGLEPFLWTQLIADCENFTLLPKMLKSLALDELKQFYRQLRKEVVRKLKPRS